MTPGLCENDYVAHEKHLRERLQAAEQRAEAAEAKVKALREALRDSDLTPEDFFGVVERLAKQKRRRPQKARAK